VLKTDQQDLPSIGMAAFFTGQKLLATMFSSITMPFDVHGSSEPAPAPQDWGSQNHAFFINHVSHSRPGLRPKKRLIQEKLDLKKRVDLARHG
jgi:hypothetical protein